MNEDVPPQVLPPSNANNTGSIKAGPKLIGKRLTDKKSTQSTQGSQRPPMDAQIIMAHKTFTQRLVEKITAKDVKMHLAVHAKIDALAKKALEGKPDSEVEVAEDYEWDKQPVNTKKKKVIPNPMDKTNQGYVSANETLSPSASSGDWIHDFVHSKNSKFDGKSKKERIKMALGAYYSHHKEEMVREEAEGIKDHTKNIYHKTLTAHGFQHHSTTQHTFSGHAYTEHHYIHPSHGKSHVTITHWHKDEKPHHFIHRHEQSNGIMAPATGENTNHLHRTLSYHYGVPKGMKPPKVTAWEKRSGHVPNYKMNESLIDDGVPEHNDFVHVGFGQRGGTGIHGHVLKVKGRRVHVKAAHKEIGMKGPYHKTFIAPIHHVTILKKGGLETVKEQKVVESIEEVLPLIENYHHATADLHRAAMQKAKEAGNFELANFHEKQMEVHKAKARTMPENFANWHEKMEKHGTADKPVQFKIKNAGGRTEAHLNGKRLGSYNHEKKIEEAKKHHKEFAVGEHVRFDGRSVDGGLQGHMTVRIVNPHSNSHEVAGVKGGREYDKHGHAHIRTATVEREALTVAGKHIPARQYEVHHHHLHEGTIHESTKDKMKRKYIGKTRGTTVTGKPAHAVIIDPVIKADKDQNLATMKANAKMPTPDRGL